MSFIKTAISAAIFTLATTANADVTQGLTARWSFDNCTAEDSSGNNKHGTISGTLSCIEGVNQKGFSFDGASFIRTSLSQTSVSNYSVSAWIKIPAGTPNGSKIIIQNRGPVGQAGASLTFGIGQNNELFYGLDSDYIGVGVVQVKQNLTDGNWHHVVGTWAGISGEPVSSAQFTIYVDGVKIRTSSYGSSALSSPLTGVGTTLIGYHEAWNVFYNGGLDDVRVYSKTLTSGEVSNIYYSTMSPVINGRASWSPLKTITCKNTTTNQIVIINKNKAKEWDCTEAGLIVNHGDKVQVIIDGTSY